VETESPDDLGVGGGRSPVDDGQTRAETESPDDLGVGGAGHQSMMDRPGLRLQIKK
jgi:hypothetical protein